MFIVNPAPTNRGWAIFIRPLTRPITPSLTAAAYPIVEISKRLVDGVDAAPR
jgi:hypothetical protein